MKSPALQARLAELQKKLEQHQYDIMLQGIAEKVLCLSSCLSIWIRLLTCVLVLSSDIRYRHNVHAMTAPGTRKR